MNLKSVSFKTVSLILALAVIISSIFLDMGRGYIDGILPSTAQAYTSPDTSVILNQMQAYTSINSDFAGWLSISNVSIDTALVKTDNGEFYLTHNLSKSASSSGTAFLDNSCDIYTDTLNTVIYGGATEIGQVFYPLWQYSSGEFTAQHSNITFSTLFEESSYEIFATVKGSRQSIKNSVLSLTENPSSISKSKFDTYIENVREIASVKTQKIPQYGARILTLCTYDTDENGQCIAVLACSK